MKIVKRGSASFRSAYYVLVLTSLTRITPSDPLNKPVGPHHPQSILPQRPPSPKAPGPDLEVEILTSPPPIEEVAAARRAKRAAILAKYEAQKSSTPAPEIRPSRQLTPVTKLETSLGPKSAGSSTPLTLTSKSVVNDAVASDGERWCVPREIRC